MAKPKRAAGADAITPQLKAGATPSGILVDKAGPVQSAATNPTRH